jgi:hypothetical protein
MKILVAKCTMLEECIHKNELRPSISKKYAGRSQSPWLANQSAERIINLKKISFENFIPESVITRRLVIFKFLITRGRSDKYQMKY